MRRRWSNSAGDARHFSAERTKSAGDCDICVPELCRSRRADKRPIHEGGNLLAIPLLMMALPQPPAGDTGALGDSTCASTYRRERGGHVPQGNYLYTGKEELNA